MLEAHLSREAHSLAPELAVALRALLGDKLRVLDDDPPFLHDRAPFLVHAQDRGALLVRLLCPSCHAPYPVPERLKHAREEVLPLVADRGLFACTGERLIVSEALLDVNVRAPEGQDTEALRGLGWRPRSVEVIKALLAEGLRKARRDIVFVPKMPGDATGHVTTWIVPLDGKLVVPDIQEAAFGAIGLVHEVALGRLVQTFLDVQAAELEQRGFVVERLPMMPPTDLVRAQHREESWLGRCSSPTAGVLLSLDDRRVAFLPRPSGEQFPRGYRDVLARSLDRWRECFSEAGYDVSFVDDQAVKARGGTLMRLCATFPRA